MSNKASTPANASPLTVKEAEQPDIVKKKGADKIPCRCAFEKWPRPAERLLLRKDRENL